MRMRATVIPLGIAHRVSVLRVWRAVQLVMVVRTELTLELFINISFLIAPSRAVNGQSVA